MKGKSSFPVLLILLGAGCVDRIYFDIGNGLSLNIAVNGHISDQQGPYKILVTKAFDIESKLSTKAPISVKGMVISDNLGNSEVLSEVNQGEYQTSPNGIRGIVGRAYKIQIELLDGRIYESVSDTLYSSGSVDSVYYSFKETKIDQASLYSFDILFNASAQKKNNYHYLWKTTATFKATTNPEMRDIMNHPAPCVDGKCNFYDLCSGLQNIGSNVLLNARFIRVAPCSCCACWYNLFSNTLITSDDQLLRDGLFTAIKAYNLPLNRWIFQYKVYITVSQLSLSRQAFAFWKGIKDQKTAANSLFQPISGKIPSNFIQISGAKTSIEGLFFATSIASKIIHITRDDVPNPSLIPPVDLPWEESCLTLFPYATTQKPTFWED